MPRLIFDTETSGLANFKLPPTDPSHPRLIQLAGLLVADDWTELSSFRFYIEHEQPVEIAASACAIHGITNEKIEQYGIPLKTALSIFTNLARKADCWAFNAEFDSLIIRSELHRIGKLDALGDFRPSCAMLGCKDILKMPRKYGGGYKFPKLSEAYAFFFQGATIGNAHDALADVRATAAVMEATDAWRLENPELVPMNRTP